LLNFTTTALLFPAIPLLLILIGNRFTVLSNLIRKLDSTMKEKTQKMEKKEDLLFQICKLNKRVKLLRNSQLFLCFGLFFNLVTIFALYAEIYLLAKYIFGIALLSTITAVGLYVKDVILSAEILDLLLQSHMDTRS